MKKGVLIILDGYGEGKPGKYNAVENANTPTLKALKKQQHSLLKTHGDAVGLFEQEMGGSEVGHMTIGAGRIVPSTAKKIKDEIDSHDFDKNKVLLKALSNLKKNNSNLHLCGLMSDKNIHSNIEHCLRIIDLAKDYANQIYVHFITDGRDCGPYDSLKYLKQFKKHTKNVENCSILSVSGRTYAMDRENNMDYTNMAFNAMFGRGDEISDVEKYIKDQHSQGKNDQYIDPVHVKSKTYKEVDKNDCLFMFNFREDRVRQMAKRCEELKCVLLTMSDVGGVNSKVVYPNNIVENTLSQYLSENGLNHVKVSETTKYAHVTYFMNGGREEPFKNEDRVHVSTIKTEDYAKTPKMRAEEIAKETIVQIEKGYDAVIVNFSNSDMIGHTGNYEATVKALECLDKCVAKILKEAKKKDYFVVVTADHGNAEEMKDEKGQNHMAHTINPVMFVVVDGQYQLKENGGLQDVAPTFVELMGLKPSKHFEGSSLIIK